MATTEQLVRAGCYLRISSDPRDKRAGVTRQREDTTTLCEIKKWTPVEFYPENDTSASNGKHRPQWERLMADIAAGTIDAVAVWDQDRAWRLMSELEELRRYFKALDRKVPLASTGQGDIDLYSPSGVMVVQIKTAVSEHEIAMMRVRQLRAALQRAESGKPKWRSAFGYQTYVGPKELDIGLREIDEERAELVRKAYRLTLVGGSLNAVAKLFNDAGAYGLNGRPWTATTVSLFLRAPRNAGLRAHNGKIVVRKDGQEVKGTWPALVDEKIWRATQSVLNGPSRKPGRKSVQRHQLTGVIYCGNPAAKHTGEPCDGTLSGMMAMDKSIVYRCKKCLGIAIKAANVEPLVLGMVADRLARPDAVDLLRAEVHDVAEAEKIRTQRQTLVARLGEIADERADGMIDGAAYRRMVERINDQLQEVDSRQQDQDRLRVLDGIPLGKPEARTAVKALSPDRLRSIIELLVTFTVLPVGRGHRVDGERQFDPNRVRVVWK